MTGEGAGSRPSDGGESPAGTGEAGDGRVALGVDRISHQLKNPLQTISVNLEVLRLRASRSAAPDEQEEIDRLAGIVERGVRTLDRRIGMLVDLARRSSGDGWRRVSLGDYVRQATAAFQLDEREHGRGLEVELPAPEEDVEVKIRPGWLLAALLDAAGTPASGEGDRGILRVEVRDGQGTLELPVPPGEDGGSDAEDTASLREAIRRAGGEMYTAGNRIEVRFPED